jgi:hypothetical protein
MTGKRCTAPQPSAFAAKRCDAGDGWLRFARNDQRRSAQYGKAGAITRKDQKFFASFFQKRSSSFKEIPK